MGVVWRTLFSLKRLTRELREKLPFKQFTALLLMMMKSNKIEEYDGQIRNMIEFMIGSDRAEQGLEATHLYLKKENDMQSEN